MRTNIDGSELLTGKRRIVVTSPTGQDGKTTTAVNLALALAAGGSSVVLVDAALGRASTEPSGDSDVSGDVRVGGLVGYIRADNGNDIMAYTEPTRYAGVRVIYAGEDVADHTEMLGTDRLRHGLEELAARFDFVIVDSASMHSSSDALVLARHADAVLLVVRSNKTHYIDLGSSLELLDSSGIPLLGVVLNGYPTNGLRAAFGRIRKSVSVRQMLTGPIHPVRQSGDDSQATSWSLRRAVGSQQMSTGLITEDGSTMICPILTGEDSGLVSSEHSVRLTISTAVHDAGADGQLTSIDPILPSESRKRAHGPAV